ncbi:hypothetical protein [Leeuwenhoekiella sp. LLG6367-2.1]|uniref:hypothetical protein n=1 Tax=Leeuwenhoekiella sp. LLG6367-2.1 TaxID=3160833 RepID=UPI003867B68A
MASFASVAIKFSADLSSFSSGVQNATRTMDQAGKKMQNIGKQMSLAITAPLVGLGTLAVKNFDIQAKAIAQVEQGLKTTENQVGKTSAELQKMASDLQNTSLFGDEAILKDVTAQLLTFTNIAGTQFERTQQAALDLATRLDGDLKSASIQLGKALNDPVANLSALSRSGIQFSEDQKKTINALVETNRLADAQTIILDELQKQYGGSAKAAADAGTGAFKQLSNSIGDLTESFGQIIAEGLRPFIDRLKGVVQVIEKLSPETKKLIVVVAAFAASLGPVLIITGTLIRNISTVIPLITRLGVVLAANPYTAAALAIAAIATAFYVFNDNAKEAIKVQSTLSQVSDTAAKSIASEKARLEELLFTARDEKLAKEQRLKAIQELNKISPKYLGDLTIETINTNAAREAIEKYNAELLRTATIKAAQEKLTALQAKLIDEELAQSKGRRDLQKEINELSKSSNQADFDKLQLLKKIQNQNTQVGGISKKLQEDRIAGIKAETQELLELIKSNGIYTDTIVNTPKPKGIEGRRKVTTVNTIKTEGANILSPLDALVAKLPTQEKIISETTGRITGDFEYIYAVANSVGDAVGDAFELLGNNVAKGLGLASDGFEGFVGGLFSTITKLISLMLASSISQSIAGATASGTATGPAAVFTTPAFIATAVGGVLSAFAAIPKFATGGIVPGNLTSGDRTLIRANAGELILNAAQQNNLARQLGGGSGSTVGRLTTKISGKDLQIVLDREAKSNKRR